MNADNVGLLTGSKPPRITIPGAATGCFPFTGCFCSLSILLPPVLTTTPRRIQQRGHWVALTCARARGSLVHGLDQSACFHGSVFPAMTYAISWQPCDQRSSLSGVGSACH